MAHVSIFAVQMVSQDSKLKDICPDSVAVMETRNCSTSFCQLDLSGVGKWSHSRFRIRIVEVIRVTISHFS